MINLAMLSVAFACYLVAGALEITCLMFPKAILWKVFAFPIDLIASTATYGLVILAFPGWWKIVAVLLLLVLIAGEYNFFTMLYDNYGMDIYGLRAYNEKKKREKKEANEVPPFPGFRRV